MVAISLEYSLLRAIFAMMITAGVGGVVLYCQGIHQSEAGRPRCSSEFAFSASHIILLTVRSLCVLLTMSCVYLFLNLLTWLTRDTHLWSHPFVDGGRVCDSIPRSLGLANCRPLFLEQWRSSHIIPSSSFSSYSRIFVIVSMCVGGRFGSQEGGRRRREC